MSRRMVLALVPAAVAFLCAGCGTVANLQRPAIAPPESPNAPVCRVYGGVRGDWETISEYPFSTTPSPLDYVVIPVLAAGDLFFAAVGDTLTLPYTLYEEGRRAFYRPGASSSTYLPVEVPQSAPAAPPARVGSGGAPVVTSPR